VWYVPEDAELTCCARLPPGLGVLSRSDPWAVNGGRRCSFGSLSTLERVFTKRGTVRTNSYAQEGFEASADDLEGTKGTGKNVIRTSRLCKII
jgi:hypothetical protein